jgi:sugar phosphate isomerase/epimerase
MARISRRHFLEAGGASAALAFMAANGIKLNAAPLGLPVGSQTYPHRARIQAEGLKGFAALMKDMKGIGIDVVELCDPWNYKDFASLQDVKTARKILDDNGIKAISCHVAMSIYRKQHKEVLNWATTIGMTQLATADLGGTTKDGRSRLNNGITTPAWIKEAADEYNAIAAETKKAGMLTVLHNEGFCNSRTADGRLTYPLLIEALDPALVGMQFQMSSMTSMGNPIMYFTIYPGRFWSAHMQGVNASQGVRGANPQTLPDKNAPPPGRRGGGAPAPAAPAAGAPAPAAGGAAPGGPAMGAGTAGGGGRGGLSVGEDSVDWPAVFTAAKTGGMKNYFIEQAWELTVKSAAYLKTLNVT